jgi:hypothetical protein
MFKIRGKFRVPEFDMDKYKEILHKHLTEVLIQSAMQWLGAATAIVPVWSGASRATFLHLARAIAYSLTIQPVTNSRIGMGLAAGEGGLRLDKDKGTFTFFYSTTLDHLVYNEYVNANEIPDPTLYSQLIEPGPYHFQEAAAEMFKSEIKEASLPDPRLALTSKVQK